jgi:ATP-dependent DNA helicase RecQ
MRNLITLNGLRLRRAARQLFGWRALRPGQMAAMKAVLRKRDALVVLPTGGGKSAVYQLPATLLPGPTIVISPLLALQQDQIAGLNERGVPQLRAVRISSAETPREKAAALGELREGTARFLFTTPEQLADPERAQQIRALRPSLVAVDEAHCISAWGYDFRPDYLSIGRLIDDLGRPPVVALTATASPPVREDIVARLGLRRTVTVVSDLDRPNLFLEVAYCPDEQYRWRRLTALLEECKGQSGIVYVPTRRAAEELAQKLKDNGYDAGFYHGGMAAGVRERRHEDFQGGEVAIMVATSAFGMGIDKPDIRWVAHVALPDSPDSYQQEIGRAGRDGQPARALLLWRMEDEALQRYFAGGSPDAGELRDLAALLRVKPLTRTQLRESSGLSARKLAQLIALLEEVGAADSLPANKVGAPPGAPEPVTAAQAALAQFERRQVVEQSRVAMMRELAQTASCRTRLLLTYFGEHATRACHHCDNCRSGGVRQLQVAAAQAAQQAAQAARVAAQPPATKAAKKAAKAATKAAIPTQPRKAQPVNGTHPFPVHSTVRHVEWGPGMVMGYEGDRMTVLFDGVGYKTLSVPVVKAQKLLV